MGPGVSSLPNTTIISSSVSYFVGNPMNNPDSESIDSFFTILMHLAAQHGDLPELRHLHCRAPDEHARFRINRLIITILMRPGAELIRRYLDLNMLHSLSSEFIDLILHIDNKLEEQYNT